MEVQYNAKVYLPSYCNMERVAKGEDMPIICDNNGEYWEKEGYPLIGSAMVTITLYSNDEIVANQIEALRAKLQNVRAENQQRENEILEKISKLQAITYVPAAAA